jgi:multiple sugar transport system substrate-binding protein
VTKRPLVPAGTGRPVRRRAIAAAAAGTTAGVMAAACGMSQGGSPAPPKTLEAGTITWLVDSSTTARMGAYERIKAAFEQQHPQISVAIVPHDDAVVAVKTLVAGGQPPDVGGVTPVWIAGLAEKGFYQPLDSFLAKDRTFRLDDYAASTIEAGRWKQRLYFLPLFANYHVLAYNAPLFAQRGVALPTDQWTWETLRDAAIRLTERAGDQTSVFGFSFSGDLNNVLPWIWSNGGAAFDNDELPTKSTMGNPKTIEALQFLVDLRQKHRVTANAADRAARPYAFDQGTVAMQLQGVAGLSTLVDRAKFDWNVQLSPKGSAGRVNFGGMLQSGIPNGAKVVDAAWALLKFMVSQAGNREFIQANQGMPPYKPAFDEYLRLPPPPTNRKAIVDALATVRPLPKAIVLETEYTVYTKAFDEMLEGRKSVRDTCLELDQVINAAMAGR